MGLLNPLLSALQAGGGSSVTPPPPGTELWSVKYASKVAGDAITINAGESVVFDLAQSPVYGEITNNGTLTVTRSRNTELRFKGFMNHGLWEIGTEADPFPLTLSHTITPSGPRASDPFVSDPKHATGSDNRGVMNMGGDRCWIGAVPAVTIFKLGDTALAGASFIVADRPVTFRAGDWLEVGTTMYWQEGMSDLSAAGYPVKDDGTNASLFGRRPGYGSEMVKVAVDVTNATTIPINATVSLNGNAAVNGTVLQYTHHGKLQYLVPPGVHEDIPGTNLSYTPYTIRPTDVFGTVNGRQVLGSRVLAAIAAGASAVLDNRATVGLLTHPIKFGAPADGDWTNFGYGAHLMDMQFAAKARMQGVEQYRVGQAGFLGRYPQHEHMRSYIPFGASSGSGTFLGDMDPAFNFTRYCSVRDSSNRGSTIHGTCGFTLFKNVYSKIDTHCIFLEDHSEERCVIDGNFVSGVGKLGYGLAFIPFDDTRNTENEIKFFDRVTIDGNTSGNIGPSGIWYTNPNNYLRNNIVAGAYVGIWNLFSENCFGLSRDCGLHPREAKHLQWLNNEAHSCVFRGLNTLHEVIDENGTLTSGIGTVGINNTPGYLGGFYHPEGSTFENANVWKVWQWYENRAFIVHYKGWTCAALKDNNAYYGDDEAGVRGVANGEFENGSFFTHTLDDYYRTYRGEPEVHSWEQSKRNVMTTYHNAVHRINCIFVPPPMGGMLLRATRHMKFTVQGAALDGWDWYENPCEELFELDHGSCYLGSQAGIPAVVYPPAYKLCDTTAPAFSTAYLASVGETPASITAKLTSYRSNSPCRKLPADGSMFERTGWWVFDHPFQLYGITPADIVYADSSPTLTHLNGVLVPANYNFTGVWMIAASGTNISGYGPGLYTDIARIYYTRLATDAVTPVATWDILGPYPDQNYPNMRNIATLNGAIVDVRWDRAQVPLPTSLLWAWHGLKFAGANIVLSVDWNGSAVWSAKIRDYDQNEIVFTGNAAPSKLALLNATINTHWVDAVNHKIWLHVWAVSTQSLTNYGNDSYHHHNVHDIAINQSYNITG